MEHRSVGYNARAALLTAFLIGALLAAAPAAGKINKHTLKGKEKRYKETTFYLNTTIGFNTFFLVPPLAGLPTEEPPKTFTFFGGVDVIDAFITTSPEPDSKVVGSLKGFFVFDNNNNAGPGLELVATAIFNEASGFGAGSTITYRGYSQQYLDVRELAITGGTGKFRLAQGWVDVSTVGGGGSGFILIFVNQFFYYDLL